MYIFKIHQTTYSTMCGVVNNRRLNTQFYTLVTFIVSKFVSIK